MGSPLRFTTPSRQGLAMKALRICRSTPFTERWP